MFWREDDEKEDEFRVPDDVFDLVFRLQGGRLDIDHAWVLSEALKQVLPADTCARIGVHGVRLPESGNGWNRPEALDAQIPLSRRTRLIIRVHRDDSETVRGISARSLRLGDNRIEVGDASVRRLSPLGTLHARAISCDPAQSEPDFLQDIADRLETMGIDVGKMICGRSGEIRTDGDSIFTRALMIADLKPEESVRLQRQGLGDSRLLGCGLFVPHKGIDAVYAAQE